MGDKMNIIKIVTSNDQTKKYYFSVSDADGPHIEACLLKLPRYGYIICVSSQIGCAQNCKFCAAHKSGFIRDLTSDEIEEQVQLIIDDNLYLRETGFQVTYMGSGEPLSNYKNVFKSIDNIRQKYSKLEKVNVSTTCPTVSAECFNTINWNKYKDFLHFQYSLHFTEDTERFKYLCPRLLNISDAINFLNKISLEINDVYKINYIPFDNLNDDFESAKNLTAIMSTAQNAVLKISRMCTILDSTLSPSNSFETFIAQVRQLVDNVEVFCSDGTDVNAGCGQFYNDSIM